MARKYSNQKIHNIPVWVIYVPTHSNKKRKYSIAYHQRWDAKVREITGGLTIGKSVKGHWISPDGETFVENMIPVQICCDTEQIVTISDMTAQHYNQKAVMFFMLTKNVVICNYQD
jgi:hypothetical protein